MLELVDTLSFEIGTLPGAKCILNATLCCGWTYHKLRKLTSEICSWHIIPQTHTKSVPAEIQNKGDNFEQGIFRDGKEQDMVEEYWAN